MHSNTPSDGGCGSSQCQCAAGAALAEPVASINGIALHASGEQPDAATLHELAYTELLRQQAVRAGLLPRHTGLTMPQLTDAQRSVIETMVEQAVHTPEPTEEECARYFEANREKYVVGQALHLRHILFAVTEGVNVNALAAHAEKALLGLLGKDAAPEHFAQLAGELSNCPSARDGGDLGWVGPDDCAPELAAELFHQSSGLWGLGVHARLVHTRFGLHIIEVLARRPGEQKTYAQVRERIAAHLGLQSQAKGLHQYMRLLVGSARVEGVELHGADSPLVQ